MNCPSCNKEVVADKLFCIWCDVFIPNPQIGKKAGVLRRWFATVIDPLIGIALFFVVAGILAGVLGGAASLFGGEAMIGASALALLIVTISYGTFYLWLLSKGMTPGKWLLNEQVVEKLSGAYPGFWRMFLREVIGKPVSGLFLGLGYLWAIWDKDSQAWHDKIAGTVVVRRPKPLIIPRAEKRIGEQAGPRRELVEEREYGTRPPLVRAEQQEVERKKKVGLVAGISAVAAAVLAVILVAQWYFTQAKREAKVGIPLRMVEEKKASQWGVITASDVILRGSHSIQSPVLTKLSPGKKVMIIEKWKAQNPDEAITTQEANLITSTGSVMLGKGKAVKIVSQTDSDYLVSCQYEGQEITGRIPASAIKRTFGEIWYHVRTETGSEGWLYGEFLKELVE